MVPQNDCCAISLRELNDLLLLFDIYYCKQIKTHLNDYN